MMKATRRRFFGLIPGGALATKMAAEQAARDITGYVDTDFPRTALRETLRGDVAECSPNPNQARSSGLIDWRKLREGAIRKALDTPECRAELESILYSRFRRVQALDYDLAANRSFSYAAKVTFQRQRLVEREIAESIEDKGSWDRVQDWKSTALSALEKLGVV